MKRIDRSVLLSMVAVWAMCLMFLFLDHVLVPGDRWGQMFFRPLPLILVPLLVACIPLLAAHRIEGTSEERGGDDSDENFKAKRTRSSKIQQAAIVWLTALVVFGMPHHKYFLWDWLFHNPVFLVVAPLILACIPFFVSDKRSLSRRAVRPLSRGQLFAWRAVHVVCHLLVGFDLLVLLTLHSADAQVHGTVKMNLLLVLGLIILVPMQILSFIRIRDSKTAGDSPRE